MKFIGKWPPPCALSTNPKTATVVPAIRPIEMMRACRRISAERCSHEA
jgi:hypothetical protein